MTEKIDVVFFVIYNQIAMLILVRLRASITEQHIKRRKPKSGIFPIIVHGMFQDSPPHWVLDKSLNRIQKV